ncbi:MAG: GlxA family transcriptional regulator [Rhodospirillales bacterium]
MGLDEDATSKAIDVSILVLPGFPLMAFSALIEPLRAANVLGAKPGYRWQIVSPDGTMVATSSGVAIKGDRSAQEAPAADRIFVCSGGNAHDYDCPAAWNWLHQQARRGCGLGAVADATFFLARAGLLQGHACTIHWQSQAAFAERFPEIDLRPELYVIDRRRYTSAGGIGAFDLTLELIEQDHDSEIALQVSQWFVHERLRRETDRQALTLRLRTGLSDPPLLRAIALMERHLESPLSAGQIADALAISRDSLERRFRRATKMTPMQYYLRLRLDRARDYLLHSTLRIGDIALACGFSDPGYFAKRFKLAFGDSPSAERRSARKDR